MEEERLRRWRDISFPVSFVSFRSLKGPHPADALRALTPLFSSYFVTSSLLTNIVRVLFLSFNEAR
jgi:hypothetical protein